VGLGHRRIGFICGNGQEHGATEQRYLGFVDEMRAHQIPVDSDLVQTGNFVFGDGLICAERMLRAAAPPTAIFASNDDMAAAVYRWRVNSGSTCRANCRWPVFDELHRWPA